jgi:trimeric autotransporter adhesin
MASINASTSGAGGLITTGDASGALDIQTAGTTAIAITSGQVVTIQGVRVGRGGGAISTNIAVGTSLSANTTGAQNNSFGLQALITNTTGSFNNAYGVNALRLNTTGAQNSAFGDGALYSNTTASNNTAIGYQAGYSNTTGANITALGKGAAFSNTTGTNITAIGTNAASSNTTGEFNIAVGGDSLFTNTTGNFNTAIGHSALVSNTTASNNTAVGYQSLYSNTTGTTNTALGVAALYSNTTGLDNLALGRIALYNSTGNANTAVGEGAGGAITTGNKNTILGRYNGNQGGLDIRTSNNFIVLSDGDGNPRGLFNNNGAFMVGKTAVTNSGNGLFVEAAGSMVATIPSGNTYHLYSSSSNSFRFYVQENGGIANFSGNNTNLSDERTKRNIELSGSYLDKICAIPVKLFNYKDEAEGEQKTLGVIAQDVEAVAPEFVNKEGWAGTEPMDGVPLKTIYTTDMMFGLMKAIQELKAEVDSLKQQINNGV